MELKWLAIILTEDILLLKQFQELGFINLYQCPKSSLKLGMSLKMRSFFLNLF